MGRGIIYDRWERERRGRRIKIKGIRGAKEK